LRKEDLHAIKKWRRRGFYSEKVLVKLLEKNGFEAVRVPVSNPSRNPLPDVIARKGKHVYAFEVKNVKYYAYYPREQIEKLFEFLDKFIPTPKKCKHAVLAAHMGKKWIFKEIPWETWENSKLPERERILKRDRGNFRVKANKSKTKTKREDQTTSNSNERD